MKTAFSVSLSELINLSLADEGTLHRLCPQTLCCLLERDTGAEHVLQSHKLQTFAKFGSQTNTSCEVLYYQ